MFEQEVSSLLDVVAYIDDEELREELEKVIPSTARSIAYARKRAAEEADKDAAGLCKFNMAWHGRCGKRGFPYCPKHASMKCRKCGAPATHDCAETFQFVCGEPLCDKHNHNSIREADVQRAMKRQRESDMHRYGELREDV